MADKLAQGVSVITTFVDGETPTAAKLNSITAQLRNASQQLERAVGDIHGQSYPYSSATSERLTLAYGRDASGALGASESRSLDIANLARLIGPASAVNPAFLEGSKEVTEPVPADVTEFCLRYPPASTATVSFSKDGVGETFETKRSVIADLAGADEYYIDDLGRVFCTSATDSVDPGTVTYTMNSAAWFGGHAGYLGSGFNVIPGPNQLSSGGSGCTIGAPDAQGRRAVSLPTLEYAQYNATMDNVALDAADPMYQEQPVLPGAITENYTSGEIIPEGFLLLKNWTTGEVYDQAQYTYSSSTSFLIGNVDITTEVDRGDVFCVITVATDITTSIDDLRRKSQHAHDRNFGEPLVPAASISDWTAGPWGSRGGFTASAVEGNYAPQYLHRYGYQSGENDWNDKNIMRGDFVVGKQGASEGGYFDSSGVSYSIYLGDTSGPRIYNNSTSLYVEVPGDILLDSGANVDIDAVGNGQFEVHGGDLSLISNGGDVRIGGGLEVFFDAGDAYVTDSWVDNVGLRVDLGAGNIAFPAQSAIGDSLAAGPFNSDRYTNNLDLWAIDENGSTSSSSTGTGSNHYATTQTTGSEAGNSGWVTPAFQVIHYAQWNRDFSANNPVEEDGGTDPVTWGNMSHWHATITLPTYLQAEFADNLGAHAVLGAIVMVKPSAANNRWFIAGGSGRFGDADGERVIAYLDADSATAGNNQIRILIAADGYNGAGGSTGQLFHKSRYQGGAASGDTPGTIDVDVKILLFVAAPTDSIGGIPNILV